VGLGNLDGADIAIRSAHSISIHRSECVDLIVFETEPSVCGIDERAEFLRRVAIGVADRHQRVQ